MKKKTFAIICLAAVTIFWSIGVESDFFANPAFSSFFWLSYQDTPNVDFFIPSIGATALLFGTDFLGTSQRRHLTTPIFLYFLN